MATSRTSVPLPPDGLAERYGLRVRGILADAPQLVLTTVHGDTAPQNVLTRAGPVVGLRDCLTRRAEGRAWDRDWVDSVLVELLELG